MTRNAFESTPRETYKVFFMGNIMYVPHYRNSSVYVGPGYPRLNTNRFSERDLIELGAMSSKAHLWTRSEHGIVNDRNP